MPLWPKQIENWENWMRPDYRITNIPNWVTQTSKAPGLTAVTWTTANLAIYTPVLVDSVVKVDFLGVLNGNVQAGLFDLGIYLPDDEGKPGILLCETGQQVQKAPSNYFQDIPASTFPVGSEVWLGPGLYYLACVFNGTTATVLQLAALTTDGLGPIAGSIFTQATAFPLPAYATPNAGAVAANVPVLCII